ncbi:MAG TPA: biotin/lipoyl-containing protein [Bacillota bacterium]|nr:biotin/lipoyl-containing protein [Bacillota bacterium]
MHHFRVTVNGKAYDVNVEELGQDKAQIVPPQLQSAAVAESAKTQPPVSLPNAGPVSIEAGDKPVVAPLSGTILAIKVNPGDQVKYGQVLLILEALKMENEIVASEAGTVKGIFVQAGSSVNVGDVLLSLS